MRPIAEVRRPNLPGDFLEGLLEKPLSSTALPSRRATSRLVDRLIANLSASNHARDEVEKIKKESHDPRVMTTSETEAIFLSAQVSDLRKKLQERDDEVNQLQQEKHHMENILEQHQIKMPAEFTVGEAVQFKYDGRWNDGIVTSVSPLKARYKILPDGKGLCYLEFRKIEDRANSNAESPHKSSDEREVTFLSPELASDVRNLGGDFAAVESSMEAYTPIQYQQASGTSPTYEISPPWRGDSDDAHRSATLACSSSSEFVSADISRKKDSPPNVGESGSITTPPRRIRSDTSDSLEAIEELAQLQASVDTLKSRLRQRDEQKHKLCGELMEARRLTWEHKRAAEHARQVLREAGVGAEGENMAPEDLLQHANELDESVLSPGRPSSPAAADRERATRMKKLSVEEREAVELREAQQHMLASTAHHPAGDVNFGPILRHPERLGVDGIADSRQGSSPKAAQLIDANAALGVHGNGSRNASANSLASVNESNEDDDIVDAESDDIELAESEDGPVEESEIDRELEMELQESDRMESPWINKAGRPSASMRPNSASRHGSSRNQNFRLKRSCAKAKLRLASEGLVACLHRAMLSDALAVLRKWAQAEKSRIAVRDLQISLDRKDRIASGSRETPPTTNEVAERAAGLGAVETTLEPQSAIEDTTLALSPERRQGNPPILPSVQPTKHKSKRGRPASANATVGRREGGADSAGGSPRSESSVLAVKHEALLKEFKSASAVVAERLSDGNLAKRRQLAACGVLEMRLASVLDPTEIAMKTNAMEKLKACVGAHFAMICLQSKARTFHAKQILESLRQKAQWRRSRPSSSGSQPTVSFDIEGDGRLRNLPRSRPSSSGSSGSAARRHQQSLRQYRQLISELTDYTTDPILESSSGGFWAADGTWISEQSYVGQEGQNGDWESRGSNISERTIARGHAYSQRPACVPRLDLQCLPDFEEPYEEEPTMAIGVVSGGGFGNTMKWPNDWSALAGSSPLMQAVMETQPPRNELDQYVASHTQGLPSINSAQQAAAKIPPGRFLGGARNGAPKAAHRGRGKLQRPKSGLPRSVGAVGATQERTPGKKERPKSSPLERPVVPRKIGKSVSGGVIESKRAEQLLDSTKAAIAFEWPPMSRAAHGHRPQTAPSAMSMKKGRPTSASMPHLVHPLRPNRSPHVESIGDADHNSKSLVNQAEPVSASYD